jgi:hypothetical protein
MSNDIAGKIKKDQNLVLIGTIESVTLEGRIHGDIGNVSARGVKLSGAVLAH